MKTYLQTPIWVAPVVSFIITFLLVLVANTFQVPPILYGIGGFLCFVILTISLNRLSNGSRAKRLEINYLSNETSEKTPEANIPTEGTTNTTTTSTTTVAETHTYPDGITRNDFGFPIGEINTKTTRQNVQQPPYFYNGTPPFCTEGLGEDL